MLLTLERADEGVAINTDWHFPVMIAASLVLFIGLLRLVLGREHFNRRRVAVLVVSGIVVVLGMLFGKYGVTALGLPWWIYYPVPALVTVVLPPLVFRLGWKRTLLYLLLSALSAPLIHALFSFFLGWDEYMPFIPIPSLESLLSGLA
ncbi:hypothetical protein [Diaminobutyricimonas sp. TR449]|uniref:hypothetical protein n=1 Tax=Diaminobutyricimonas sp. TR449 TaxID=2708076 RepID=UPI001424438C|nr:hypothetical protein [Diaminobutyricimonas sp. TR449]